MMKKEKLNVMGGSRRHARGVVLGGVLCIVVMLAAPGHVQAFRMLAHADEQQDAESTPALRGAFTQVVQRDADAAYIFAGTALEKEPGFAKQT